jgi:hypothetical protein
MRAVGIAWLALPAEIIFTRQRCGIFRNAFVGRVGIGCLSPVTVNFKVSNCRVFDRPRRRAR